MIIDVHTHTPRHRDPVAEGEATTNAQWRPDKVSSSAHTWEDHMKALEVVDRAIVFNIAGMPDDRVHAGGLQYPPPEVNDDTAAFVNAYPEKLIGFLSVNPRDSNALDEVERATGDLGLRGIKFGPNYQNFDPLSPEAFAVFKRAEELGLPVLFHQGTSPDQFADLDFAHPRHIDRVAIAFSELRVILAHMGHPWQIDCIAVVRKHPHVYADISAQFYRPWSYYNAFRLATEWGVMEKLLFGSDYPIASPRETMEALYHVNDLTEGTSLPRVPMEAMADILNRNSLELLGLE